MIVDLVLVENGEVWDPKPCGIFTLLMRAEIDKRALERAELEIDRVDEKTNRSSHLQGEEKLKRAA